MKTKATKRSIQEEKDLYYINMLKQFENAWFDILENHHGTIEREKQLSDLAMNLSTKLYKERYA